MAGQLRRLMQGMKMTNISNLICDKAFDMATFEYYVPHDAPNYSPRIELLINTFINDRPRIDLDIMYREYRKI